MTTPPTPPTSPADLTPQSVLQMIELLGEDAAAAVTAALPGQRVYVPQSLPDQHVLIDRLGRELAAAIVTHYGGEFLTVPACMRQHQAERDEQILADRAAGESVTILAARYGLTERGVYYILKNRGGVPRPSRAVRDEKTLDLFSDH